MKLILLLLCLNPFYKIEMIRDVLVFCQVLDERETKFIFIKKEEFDSDFQQMMRRCEELEDAPPIECSRFFPNREFVNEFLVFNVAYRTFLEEKAHINSDRIVDEVNVVIAETNKLYRFWDAVRDAKCEYYYVSVRRIALKRIEKMVGDDFQNPATWPPYIPLWRFNEINMVAYPKKKLAPLLPMKPPPPEIIDR